MNPRFLLDTHIVVRWLNDPKRLSREQARVLKAAIQRQQPLAISAITLLEIVALFGKGTLRKGASATELLGGLEADPVFRIVPFTIDIAVEVAALGGIPRDLADRAIVATARVHKLQLVTSDEQIIESALVPVAV